MMQRREGLGRGAVCMIVQQRLVPAMQAGGTGLSLTACCHAKRHPYLAPSIILFCTFSVLLSEGVAGLQAHELSAFQQAAGQANLTCESQFKPCLAGKWLTPPSAAITTPPAAITTPNVHHYHQCSCLAAGLKAAFGSQSQGIAPTTHPRQVAQLSTGHQADLCSCRSLLVMLLQIYQTEGACMQVPCPTQSTTGHLGGSSKALPI